MDIICARCGRHFNSIEAAREHKCRENPEDEPIQWKRPRNSKISPEEWAKIVKSINKPSEPTITKIVCPNCKKYLYYDFEKELWICKEKSCKRIYKYSDLHKKRTSVKDKTSRTQAEERKPTINVNQEEKAGKTTVTKKPPINAFPKWITAVLFVFAFSILGWGISLAVGNAIPLLMLIGFSIIFSIEKGFSHFTRRYKSIGKLYRLILNLSILSLLGLLIWSGVQLFSQQFFSNSIIGSFVFIAELILFVWIWKIVAKNSWRWPSMKLTVFTLIALFLVFSYAGVEPIKSYKDTAFSYIGSIFSNSGEEIEDVQQTPLSSTTTPVLETTSYEDETEKIDENTGIYEDYYLGLIKSPEGVLSGEECYGEFIILINNENAKNPTYAELVNFLKSDKTDEYPYQYTLTILDSYYGDAEDNIDLKRIQSIIDGIEEPDPPKICADFAERLHNNAEMNGIRCGYVEIGSINHALNIFETTDRGTIYIDDTGTFLFGPSNCDKRVDVREGIEYIPISLFPEFGWSDTWDSLGIIDDILITWDGEWR